MGTTPTMDVARAVMLEPPEEDELESIRRELEREAGYPSWEPEKRLETNGISVRAVPSP